MSHQVLLLSVLQSYTSVIIPTSVCSQTHLVSFLIPLSLSLFLGEHRTAVGPMTMIMRAEGHDLQHHDQLISLYNRLSNPKTDSVMKDYFAFFLSLSDPKFSQEVGNFLHFTLFLLNRMPTIK